MGFEHPHPSKDSCNILLETPRNMTVLSYSFCSTNRVKCFGHVGPCDFPTKSLTTNEQLLTLHRLKHEKHICTHNNTEPAVSTIADSNFTTDGAADYAQPPLDRTDLRNPCRTTTPQKTTLISVDCRTGKSLRIHWRPSIARGTVLLQYRIG